MIQIVYTQTQAPTATSLRLFMFMSVPCFVVFVFATAIRVSILVFVFLHGLSRAVSMAEVRSTRRCCHGTIYHVTHVTGLNVMAEEQPDLLDCYYTRLPCP